MGTEFDCGNWSAVLRRPFPTKRTRPYTAAQIAEMQARVERVRLYCAEVVAAGLDCPSYIDRKRT